MTFVTTILALILSYEIWQLISINGTLFFVFCGALGVYISIQYLKHRSNKTNFRLNKRDNLMWLEVTAIALVIGSLILIINRIGAT